MLPVPPYRLSRALGPVRRDVQRQRCAGLEQREAFERDVAGAHLPPRRGAVCVDVCLAVCCSRGRTVARYRRSEVMEGKVKPIPVAMDSEGMRADDLRKILSEWDESVRGAKR